jgi:phosphate transport system substrate-binding protein
MKKTLRGSFGTAVAVLGLAASIVVPAGAATVKVDPILSKDTTIIANATVASSGATFDTPFFSAAFPAYAARNGRATVGTYGAGGSGAGQTAIMSNTVNFAASDVPMTAADITASSASTKGSLSDYVQIPVALGGVAIAFRASAITNAKNYAKDGFVLDATTIAKIYTGAITYWNDPAICALNPKYSVTYKGTKSCSLPEKQIIVNARSDSSGTTYIFKDYMHAAAPSIFTSSPSKTTMVTSGNGFVGGSGNQGVAANLENTDYSLGYVEYSYVLLNRTLDAAKLVNAAGKTVAINPASIAAAAATKTTVSSTSFSIVNATGNTSYPISGYSWAMVRKNQSGDAKASTYAEAELTVKLLDWLTHSAPAKSGLIFGQEIAAQQGYVALPAAAQTVARDGLSTITYNGSAILK